MMAIPYLNIKQLNDVDKYLNNELEFCKFEFKYLSIVDPLAEILK